MDARAGGQVDRRHQGVARDGEGRVADEVERLVAPLDDPAVGAQAADGRGAPAEVGADVEPEVEGEAAGAPLEAADDGAEGDWVAPLLGLGQGRHEVGQAGLARLGREVGRQQVRAGPVRLAGPERPARLDAERAAAVGVEQARKDGVAVEARQAPPVDRAGA